MTIVLIMLTLQSLVGAFDNLWHHEITEDLTHKPSARGELMLHTVREFLYAVIFGSIAWFRWEGAWAFVFMAIMTIEIVVTLWDFVLEDQTRRLPAFERVLHTLLAINFGAVLAVWAPELKSWALAPTAMTPAYYGIWSGVMSAFSAGVFAWALYDLRAVIRLGTPAWQRDPLIQAQHETTRTVLVTGATGFIGRALVRALVRRGDHVIALTRDPAKARDLFGPAVEIVGTLELIATNRPIAAIVNLAGEPLTGGLWTRARKQRFLESRLGVTDQLLALIRRLDVKPGALINASAIGYYGNRGAEVLSEASGPQPIFMSELCRLWEQRAEEATQWGVRVVRLRIGLVMGAGGGALPPLALAARFGLGAVMGDGRQIVSWIHIEDLVRLVLFALNTRSIDGAVNAVAPQPIGQADLMMALAKSYGRQIRLKVPAWLLRRAIGEMSALFLASQHVVPVRTNAAGFAFRFADIEAACADLVKLQAQSDVAKTSRDRSINSPGGDELTRWL